MRSTTMKNTYLKTSALTVSLLLAAGASVAGTTTINMTAQRTSATFADGTTVPMWGMCSPDTNGAAALGGATLAGGSCTTAADVWTPGPTITVPYDAAGTTLTITLTNNLPTPTSIVILGQIGGGLGSPVKIPSPTHYPTQPTWPAAPAVDSPYFAPPAQPDRARSFSNEAGVNGGSQTYTWNNLRPGTYIYETGTHPSIQAPMGLYGMLIVTASPAAGAAGNAYPNTTAGIAYDADASMLFSDVDPTMNSTVDQAAQSAGCPALRGACSGTINEDFYPQAVNFTPKYFLINGKSFDPTLLTGNTFEIPAAAPSGNVLVRFANAGLHNYDPALLGLPMSVVAEDGFVKPGKPQVKNEMIVAAGKTFDIVVTPPRDATALTYNPGVFGILDRQLSLSANKQPGGMQAMLRVAGGTLPTAMQCAANSDAYTVALNSTFFSGNVLSNDRGVANLVLDTNGASGTVTLNSNGSFSYTPSGGAIVADSFTYHGTCSDGTQSATATVSLAVAAKGGDPIAVGDDYTSKLSSLLTVNVPGVLVNDTDPSKYKLSAVLDGTDAGLTVVLNADGSFTAQPVTPPTTATTYNFSYHAVNAQGTASGIVNVALHFQPASGLQVSVMDTQDRTLPPLDDYSWVIEEDQTYYHDPKNPNESDPAKIVSTNFHKSFMPVVAAGCTGPRSCGDLNFIAGTAVVQKIRTTPADVVLDPNKRYYISILPGDAIDGDPDAGTFGHTTAGATIQPGQTAVTVLATRNPLPAGQISVIVFEDKGPTNGSVDAGEYGLGSFNIKLADTRGSTGDVAGLMTYDLSGMPITNALANTIDSVTGYNLCPIPGPIGTVTTCPANAQDANGNEVVNADGSPSSTLAGMALIKNVPPGRYDVIAIPGMDRLNRNETWVQVSTLEGAPVNDTFIKPGEPGYWQEFGMPGFHAFVGFVNPAHVDAAKAALQADPANHATNSITGKISSLHMDRPPGATLNDSCATQPGQAGYDTDPTCRASLNFTQCIVSVNLNTNSDNISYAQCDENGNFTLTGVPPGLHEIVIWDQWLDQIIAKKAVTVPQGDNQIVATGTTPVFSWFTRIEQTACLDLDLPGTPGYGKCDETDPGLPMVPLNLRFRDGSIANYLATDLVGSGGSNEVFPLFNWYVLETDTTRYKGTGVHVIYDAGGKPDVAGPYAGVMNTTETTSLPANLQVPGATYVAGTTERIDPGTVTTEGVQSFINQTSVIEWAKTPYAVGENGGIAGMVFYASTRALDDPALNGQLSWNPGVARVTVNLYSKKINADGTESLALVDTTTTSSWDDNTANMHCPGDPLSDPFVTSTLKGDQFKCYDGQHTFNQVQPAVYDGRYTFPSDKWLADPANNGAKFLPLGKYVVEVVLPEGYEITKEEDKNVLNGDAWLSPNGATQFANGTDLGHIYILPDTATLNNSAAYYTGSAFPPCVGKMHTVPDFLTLFPEAQNISPYVGQDRPLCDRKEIDLTDQTKQGADFPIFTQAPISAHLTGIMLNDASAEFNPFSPSFGEKAALPNAPVAFRDYNGVEFARLYNDKYGDFNGLMPSTWNANVPNPSGYAPNMLTSCMNDPGPIPDPNGTIDPSTGEVRMIIDPLYNPMFSNFCYVWPYMPGITTYLDTPVLPIAAFANAAGYAPVDCQYPDATPAISRVDGDGVGPWVAAADGTHTLTITALGDVDVLNPEYAGPTVNTGNASKARITRHYGFGGAAGTVMVNGTALTVSSWSDATIVATIPAGVSSGQLVITTSNGKQTIDTVTVHIEPTAPVVVKAAHPQTSGATELAHPIQDAIDAASAGDLIIIDAGHYPELVVMDKPVRLQGVGAASVIINATKYPNQKLDSWRNRVNNDFGYDNFGASIGAPVVDPLPGQTVNTGVLQLEPSVLGTEQGPGITVIAKHYANDANGNVTTTELTSADCTYKANFLCADGARRARIDGVSVTGSDAGGGIYVNGWANNLEIANNRVFGNAGPLNGGIRIGQPYMEGPALPANLTARLQNFALGYNPNVFIHHNSITTNGMVEGAPGAANAANAGGAGGGLSICAGTDDYVVSNNWVCGNFSSSDGGGIGHIGHSHNGTIKNNWILFNESYNQTGEQSGGGLAIEGEVIGTSTIGTGNVTVDGNIIQGNFARAGHGGGVRLQNVNGDDVAYSYTNAAGTVIYPWWRVTMVNNIITNNLAGYSGGGIAMVDTVNSRIINNTVVSNDSTGITGGLFNTNVGGISTGPATAVPNPAGVSSQLTTATLPFPTVDLQTANTISKPEMRNNIVWHNRSFFFDMADGVAKLIPSNNWDDAVAAAKPAPLGQQTATGECVAGAAYWDMGVVGQDHSTAVPADANLHLDTIFSILTVQIANYSPAQNIYSDPLLARVYCNGSRVQPGLAFEPGTPFLPNFQLNVAAALDESGNFVDLQFGPLSLMDPANPAQVNGDGHLSGVTSPAINAGGNTNATKVDVDNEPRANNAYDIGADEIPLPVVSIIPANQIVNFGTVANGSLNQRTVTVTNTGLAPLVISSAVVTNDQTQAYFSKGADSCSGQTIAVGASCTVTVIFRPLTLPVAGALWTGALTITDNAFNSPQVVQLRGR